MTDSTADRILDLIDAGMQSSPEVGAGTDQAPGLCARCQHTEPGEGGEMCVGCRAFLLGDSDTDPADQLAPVGLVADLVRACGVSADDAATSVEAVLRAGWGVVQVGNAEPGGLLEALALDERCATLTVDQVHTTDDGQRWLVVQG